jgi:hypothetical protein
MCKFSIFAFIIAPSLVIGATTVHADTFRCSAVFDPPASIDNDASVRPNAEFSGVIEKINKIALESGLEPYMGIELKIVLGQKQGSSYNNSHISGESALIFLEEQTGVPRLTTLILLSHEFGHAIFDKNIRRNSANWLESENSYDDPSWQLKNLRSLLAQKKVLAEAQDDVEKLRALKQLNAIKAVPEQMFTQHIFRKALHELFADIATVVYTGSPRAMYDAVRFTDPKLLAAPGKMSSVELETVFFITRKFDVEWTDARIAEWKSEMARELAIEKPNFHAILAPARAAFWQAYKEQLSQPGQKRDQVLGRAFAVLKRIYENHQGEFSRLDVATFWEINQILTREFAESSRQ